MQSTPDVSILLESSADAQAEVRKAVHQGLSDFNLHQAGLGKTSPLTLAAKDSEGTLIGGLVGDTGWGWLYVNLLWVADRCRRQGIGRQLLRAAEAESVRRGCAHAFLRTFDFQAPGFYEREGYVVFGVQENFPLGHRGFYLRKDLQR